MWRPSGSLEEGGFPSTRLAPRRMRRSLAVGLVAASILSACRSFLPLPAHAADLLILDSTVAGGTSSLEFTIASGLGLSVDWATPSSWGLKAYGGYKAIVLGDPGCTFGSLAAAEANAAVWGAAVTGNVVIIGTDPGTHNSSTLPGPAQLMKSAIQFAAAGPGTGAVIVLSCRYSGASAGTTVNVLGGLGIFKAQGATAEQVSIVATHPALSGLTDALLSTWGNSVHEGFNSWPASFMPLAIATDASLPHTFPRDDPKGFPYILARGVHPLEEGIVKVCKVAGLGVATGTPFTFSAGSSTFTVPAGPGPGGTCVVGPSFSVGSVVTVDEVVPSGYVVSSIVVAPASQLAGAPDLAAGSVSVTVGNGVTEVTYTDQRTGFLEICKRGDVKGNFTFTVNPGGLGPFVVPADACSPAIEVPAGQVVITEMPSHNGAMAGCSTLPAGQQGPCDLAAQSSTVTVAPGDVAAQTIAIITNRPRHLHTDSHDEESLPVGR